MAMANRIAKRMGFDVIFIVVPPKYYIRYFIFIHRFNLGVHYG